jgi:hypothetical protein
MSMHYSVYIGPFARYTRKPEAADAYDLTNGQLCDLRGELEGEDGDVRCAGPNIHMPGIDRQMRFERQEPAPIQYNMQRVPETNAFSIQFAAEIRALRREHGDGNVSIEWGVVPRIS